MKKENKTKRTWLKSNRNSLIALALLIIVVIGSTFTSSWYDNSGTLETNLGEGNITIDTDLSDVNKNILKSALQLYKDSYDGVKDSYTADCSSYIDKVLYNAGYLGSQNLSSNTTTWWTSATSFGLNGSYKIVEVAEGIGFNTPWYSKDKFEGDSIMPGDIIIGKTWTYSKNAGDTDFPTVEYKGSTYYAYPSGTGHSMIFLGQHEDTSALTSTLESWTGISLSGYGNNISDYNEGADNYFTIYNDGSGNVNIADSSWTATYGSTDATQKNLFAYKVYRIVPVTTSISFDIKKVSTEDSSENVNATFEYALTQSTEEPSSYTTYTANETGTVSFENLDYSTSGTTTYYLHLKETSAPSGYINDYSSDCYSTIKINSSGNVSSWSTLSGGVTSSLSHSGNHYTYTLEDPPDDKPVTINIKKELLYGSNRVSDNGTLKFSVYINSVSSSSSTWTYVTTQTIKMNGTDYYSLSLSVQDGVTAYIKIVEESMSISGNFVASGSLGTVIVSVCNGSWRTYSSTSGSVEFDKNGSSYDLSILLKNPVKRPNPASFSIYKVDDSGNSLGGVAYTGYNLLYWANTGAGEDDEELICGRVYEDNTLEGIFTVATDYTSTSGTLVADTGESDADTGLMYHGVIGAGDIGTGNASDLTLPSTFTQAIFFKESGSVSGYTNTDSDSKYWWIFTIERSSNGKISNVKVWRIEDSAFSISKANMHAILLGLYKNSENNKDFNVRGYTLNAKDWTYWTYTIKYMGTAKTDSTNSSSSLTVSASDKHDKLTVELNKSTGKVAFYLTNNAIEGEYTLNVEKRGTDDTNTKLTGAIFSYKAWLDGTSTSTSVDEVEVENEISITREITPTTTGRDYYHIKEVSPPSGYIKNFNGSIGLRSL